MRSSAPITLFGWIGLAAALALPRPDAPTDATFLPAAASVRGMVICRPEPLTIVTVLVVVLLATTGPACAGATAATAATVPKRPAPADLMTRCRQRFVEFMLLPVLSPEGHCLRESWRQIDRLDAG